MDVLAKWEPGLSQAKHSVDGVDKHPNTLLHDIGRSTPGHQENNMKNLRSPACSKNSNASQSQKQQMACLIHSTLLMEQRSNFGNSPLDLNRWISLLDKVRNVGSITTALSGSVVVPVIIWIHTYYKLYTWPTSIIVQNKYRPKVTEILTKRHATYSGRHRQPEWLPWAQRAVPMFQCCWCDRLVSTQKAVKTHISNLTKMDKGVLLLFTGKSICKLLGLNYVIIGNNGNNR